MNLRRNLLSLLEQVADNVFESGEEWPEMFVMINNSLTVTINDSSIQSIELGLSMLFFIIPFKIHELVNIADTITTSLSSFFATNSVSLRIAASKVVMKFLIIIEKKHVKKFSGFITNILLLTQEVFNNRDEESLKVLIVQFTRLLESEPKVLKSKFDDFVSLMGSIFICKDLVNEKVNEVALSAIVSLVEYYEGKLSKHPEKVKQLVGLMINYASEIDDEITDKFVNPPIDTFSEETLVEEEKLQFIYSSLETLVEHIGESKVGPILEGLLSQYLMNNTDWRYKYIALTLLYMISDYKDSYTEMDKIIEIVLEHALYENTKICYAALLTITRIIKLYKKKFILQHHEKVINILRNKLQSTSKRIVLATLEVFDCFFEMSPNEVNQAYYVQILDDTLILFENSQDIAIKESSLELITEIFCEEKISKEIAIKVLNGIANYFNNVYQTGQQKYLYGTYCQCICNVGVCCKEEFITFLPNLLKIMVQLQMQIKETKEPIHNCLRNGFIKIAPLIKEHYPNYIPDIITSVLALINKIPEMNRNSDLIAEQSLGQLCQADDDNLKLVCVSPQTSETEDIKSCFELFFDLSKEFDTLIVSQINEINTVVLDFLHFLIEDNVRKEAAKCIPLFTGILKRSNATDTLVDSSKLYLRTLILALNEEPKIDVKTEYSYALSGVFKEAGTFLSTSNLNEIFQNIMDIFAKTEKTRLLFLEKQDEVTNSKVQRHANEDDDSDDDDHSYHDEIEENQDLLIALSDVIGSLFDSHKLLTIDILNNLIANFLPNFFRNGASTFEITMGVYIVDDVIEFLGQEAAGSVWGDMAAILFQLADHEDSVIRQAVLYGIGFFAENTIKGFENYAENLLIALNKGLVFTKDQQEDYTNWGTVKDNGTTALAKLLKYQVSYVPVDAVLHKWLTSMPIEHDEDERELNYNFLCELLISNMNRMMLTDYSGLRQIVKIAAYCYGSNKNSYEEFDTQLKTIFGEIVKDENRKMIVIDEYNKTTNSKQKQRLERLLS